MRNAQTTTRGAIMFGLIAASLVTLGGCSSAEDGSESVPVPAAATVQTQDAVDDICRGFVSAATKAGLAVNACQAKTPAQDCSAEIGAANVANARASRCITCVQATGHDCPPQTTGPSGS